MAIGEEVKESRREREGWRDRRVRVCARTYVYVYVHTHARVFVSV